MDSLKEIIDAFEARVRSKVVGSVFLAFIAMNWKVIFYVIFAGETPETKFKYFDEHTNIWTLFTYPVCIGIGLAMLLPWVNAGAMFLTLKADKKQSDLKNDMKSFNSMSKELSELKYEAEKADALATMKAAAVKSAKADEEAEMIQNDKRRTKLIDELGNVSLVSDAKHSNKVRNTVSNLANAPLDLIKDELHAIDNSLKSDYTAQKELNSHLANAMQNEAGQQVDYKNELEEAIDDNDEKRMLTLKLQRAHEKENFNNLETSLREDIDLLGAEIIEQEEIKSQLISIVEKKYDL